MYLSEQRQTVSVTKDTDVLYLKLLTKDFVVLNSTEAITDLIEKRSNIYCDRVSFHEVHACMLAHPCGGNTARHTDA